MSGNHAVIAFALFGQPIAESEVIVVERLEELQVLQFLFLALFFVEVPKFQFLVVQDVVEHGFCIDAVLVDFVKVLGHLCGLATEYAEVAVLFNVQLCVNVNQLKQQVDVVGKRDAAPLGDGLFYGKHLRQPEGLLTIVFEGVAQIKGRTFVWKDYGQFLLSEVVVALDMLRQLGYESVLAHFMRLLR